MTVDTVTPRSRRNLLLGALGGLAAAAAATVSGAQRVLAAGDDGAVIHIGDLLTDVRNETRLANNTNDLTAFKGINNQAGIGLAGSSFNGTGVYGSSIHGTAVHGEVTTGSGLTFAVLGESHSTGGVGVLGNNYATTGNAQGLQGTSDSPKGFATTGWARHNGTGVIGVSGGTFPSVPAHTGGYFKASSGRGVVASGGTAQLRLVPSSDSSHPHSGSAGDLFLDKHSRLWLCKGSTSWHQLG